MGKLNEWFRKLLGGSPRRQLNEPQGSGVTEAPSDRSQSEETQLRLTDSVRIREAVPQTAWQERGRYLQAADGTGSRVRPVHLGVDFGTALTKVAVRVADFVFFIPWDELIGDAGYLLPGRLSSTKNGASVPGTGKCQALKEPFLPGNLADEDDHVRAVEFLAGVIRFSRAWLYNNQPNLVRNYRLAWNLRIGCPTNLFEADDSKDVYKRLAIVAWVASQSARLLTAEDVRRMLRARVVETDTGLDELEAVPEFVAQITSYSHSPQRVDGLHLLVDCGAGTVDVVSFNVFRHPNSLEDRYPIWWSAVQPKGTRFLMERYLGDLSGIQWDTDAPVPDRKELQDRFGVEQSTIVEVEREFRRDLAQIICNVLRYTRQKRYTTAPEWNEGLPVFISGGGASCNVYVDSVTTGCKQVPVTPSRRTVPLPEGLTQADISSGLFHRLSVAYGLTFDPGRIYASGETEDDGRPVGDVASRS